MKKRKKKKLFPPKPLTTHEKWMIRLALSISLIFVFIGMLSCVEIDEMDNNLSGVTFFFVFFFLGLVIAYFANSLIEKRLPEYIVKSKSYKTIEGSFFALALILPALANYYNRTCPLSKTNYETLRIIEKDKHYRRGSYDYWIYVDIDNEKERLSTDEETFNTLNEYGYVKLGIATGGLGFKYISEIHAN